MPSHSERTPPLSYIVRAAVLAAVPGGPAAAQDRTKPIVDHAARNRTRLQARQVCNILIL